MENQNYYNETDCVGKLCGYQVGGSSLACTSTGAGCRPVDLVEAEPSGFHDSHLIEVTRAIKEILAKIPADAAGRKISFIDTNMGTLLAWVDHSGVTLENAVTQDDDDAKIAAALKLKNVTFAGAAQAN